ncbi:unnamed protein product [Schistosoma curassoni]|uniref:Uncharacterized protein n=1 Tax=Schistosoma curassoni TaxID=6186 RepID=A0A183JX92_9TREM|nr:unnamed protein product [Schistosoma curassoni]
MGQKFEELRKLSSTRYKCLLTNVYAKYFESVDQTLSATTYRGIEQTRFQRRNKSGRSAGSECDTQDKQSLGILKAEGEEEDQRTHYSKKWRRYKKNEQQLNRTGIKVSKHVVLENAGRQPMLR